MGWEADDFHVAERSLAALCEHLRLLLEASDARLLTCDVRSVADADLATVDLLARLQLTAGRLGSTVSLRHATSDLRELLALIGLSDVVPCSDGLRLERRRQAEEGEQPRGIQEERDAADPTA